MDSRIKIKMSLVRQILPRFPISKIRTSFGYGSSVFPQRGNEGKDRQIDLILITGRFRNYFVAAAQSKIETRQPITRRPESIISILI